tara:strand:- start:110 stop:649 length:540 start_codon:yes stop_codon:yes gene_type:complete
MTSASYITLTRVLLIPLIIYLTSFQIMTLNLLALLLFLVASLTDYFDGKIARKTNTETSLGALLDLIADKLLVCVILIWLNFITQSVYLVIPTILIVSRELIISSVRQIIMESRESKPINVSNLGKVKTTIQFISISFLIISPGLNVNFTLFAIALIWIAAVISILSLIDYLRSYKVYF